MSHEIKVLSAAADYQSAFLPEKTGTGEAALYAPGRIAIARALINDPTIIMGGEPTGNLDSANSLNVFRIFQELAHVHQQTIIAVTHDEEFARNTNRTIEMKDGSIVP